MKKLIAALLSLLMLFTAILSGCGSETANDTSDTSSAPDISDDTSTDASQPETPYFDEAKEFLNLQTVWKYLDDGTDPASGSDRTSWTAIDFDDSAWKTNDGVDAVFGAKAGKLADLGSGFIPKVLLNHYQNNTSTCVPTYFFRGEFNLDALPKDHFSIVGALYYDDAAIIYLNGTRIAAFDEPEGGFPTNLSYGGSGNVEPKYVTFSADASLLKLGKNVLSVEIHNQRNNSSDIYFSLETFGADLPDAENITMNVGANETQRNYTWYFNSEAPGSVEYAVRNGDEFPAEFSSAASTTEKINNTYIHRATITDLKPNTQYVYRIVNGNSYSQNYYFETDPADSFNFIFVGDPQIGGSWGGQDDASEWAKTVALAKEMFPNTSLLISAGDQVETCTSEENYKGFLSPESLGGLAIATTVGNHDTYSELYSQHFNNPNTEINGVSYGSTAAGGDYWYRYNNALFLHLNTNNISVADHKAFIQSAIMDNLDAQWRIVVMHQAMFGAGSYFTETVIENIRNLMAPVMDEFDIDVVLNGHEHSYSRSYMIENGFTPYTYEGVQSSVHNPKGILYITGSSSSGSKYYNLHNEASIPHSAVKESHVTTFSNVEITDVSFKITTYRTKDRTVLDTFEITKDAPDEDEPQLPEWGEDMAESVIAHDFTIPLGTSYCGGALIGTTYGGEEFVVGINQTDITLHSGADVLEYKNGKLTAIKEGTATVSFSYTAELPYGSTYVLETEPVTVTVNKGDKLALAVMIKAAEHISENDYSEERYNEIKSILDDALKIFTKVNADESEIIEICPRFAAALSDHCINKSVSSHKPYTTTEPNYHSFSDSFVDDGIRLTDGNLSTVDPTVNSYSAWNNSVNPVEIVLDLGEDTLSNVYTLYSAGGFWGIKNCESIKIFGSDDGKTFTEIGAEAVVTPLGDGNTVDESVISLNSVTVASDTVQNYRYIKFQIQVNGNFLWIDEVEARLVVGVPKNS